MNLSSLLLPLILTITPPLLADDLSAELETIREKQHLPAMAVMVFDGTKVLHQGVTGVRKQGDPTIATLQDRWHLGSITKSMTASLAAMIVEDGKLSWDLPIAKAFPGSDAGFAAVTLHSLLEHRGGISHDGPAKIWNAFVERKGTSQQTRTWWVREILSQPPEHPPGTFDYSNPGVAAVGAMLESATGKDWESLIRTRLFKPLGLASAGFGAPAPLGTVDQPWGHDQSGHPIAPGPQADNPPGLGPAGTVHLSIADLATYGQWHLTEGKSHPGLLKAAAWKTLHTPRFPAENGSAYECGWVILNRDWAKGTALTHSGSNNMNYAILWLAPKIDYGFAVVINQGGDAAANAAELAAQLCVKKIP